MTNSSLLTPEGLLAAETDRIMLLALWAKKLKKQQNHKVNLSTNQYTHSYPIIFAGMGKPTFPVNLKVAKAAMNYWEEIRSKSEEARSYLTTNSTKLKKSKSSLVVDLDGAIDYGDPQGDEKPRIQMAKALTEWYGNSVDIKPENIIFTVGGVAALHCVFRLLSKRFPLGRIITPFPHYTLYSGIDKKNNLYPIDVMNQRGYKLTAEAVKESIQKAKQAALVDGGDISAFLFCDPNNPLGTVVGADEWKKIAAVLRNEPNTLIILDEAYAEMQLNGERCASLLEVAPDLKERIVLIRSGTKGLSAAGERLAVAVSFSKDIMNQLRLENIGINGIAPCSLQYAFAEAMTGLLDSIEHESIVNFYKPLVQLVESNLKLIGAAMPDPDYKVEGTFYVLTDLSALIGQPLYLGAKEALGQDHSGIIETDEDIAYHLLFKWGVMIAPLSYYGVDPKKGFLRITCSGGDTELVELCKRLEKALHEAYSNNYNVRLSDCYFWFNKLSKLVETETICYQHEIIKFYNNLQNIDLKSALELKQLSSSLSAFTSTIREKYTEAIKNRSEPDIINLQAIIRAELAKNKYQVDRMIIPYENWLLKAEIENQRKRDEAEQERKKLDICKHHYQSFFKLAKTEPRFNHSGCVLSLDDAIKQCSERSLGNILESPVTLKNPFFENYRSHKRRCSFEDTNPKQKQYIKISL